MSEIRTYATAEAVADAAAENAVEILREARIKGKLPVAVVADTVETNGGEVRWLYDDAAWGER